MNEPNEATLQATAAHLTEKMDAYILTEYRDLLDTIKQARGKLASLAGWRAHMNDMVRAAKAQAWVEGLSAGWASQARSANPYLDKAEQEAQG